MWYLLRTLFFMWLLISSVVLTSYDYFPTELGIIMASGFFLLTAVSFASIMIDE